MVPKFRAWSKPFQRMEDLTTLEFTDGELDYICFDYEGTGYWPSQVILMPSTGLFDKKGVEIFDGDVIAYQCTMETHGTDEVEHAYVEFVNTVPYAVNPQYERSRDNILLDGSDWEVIGNIYENPELVKNQ